MKRISKVLLLALMVCTLFAGCSIETIQSKKEDSKYNFIISIQMRLRSRVNPMSQKKKQKNTW